MLDIEEDKGEVTINTTDAMSQAKIYKAIIQRYFDLLIQNFCWMKFHNFICT
jgi:hypothetical protein